MKTLLPSSEFFEGSGDSGSLCYYLPLTKVKELGAIFKVIDSKKDISPDEEEEQTTSKSERKVLTNLKKLIKDVGVS